MVSLLTYGVMILCVINCARLLSYIDMTFTLTINSSPPSAAFMHQWIGSALVQIMACRLFGAKPVSKPMLCYCQLDPWEQTLVKLLSKYKTFYSRKCIWKYHLRNGDHFVKGGWDNMAIILQMHVLIHFVEWKLLNFDSNSIEVCS